MDNTVTITHVSESVRYLGFRLKDRNAVDLIYHISERANKVAVDFESYILKWCSNNYYFSSPVVLSILRTRSISKL
jgi:hypothetical protein